MPGAIVAELLTLAKKLNNYEIDPVTGLKVLWVDTTHYKVVCPAAKRWFLISGVVNRNVSSTVNVTLHNVGDVAIDTLLVEGAAAALNSYPEAAYQVGAQRVLDAGEYIQAYFGTAQDAGSWATCVVLEVDV